MPGATNSGFGADETTPARQAAVEAASNVKHNGEKPTVLANFKHILNDDLFIFRERSVNGITYRFPLLP
jgi:hypothetical protein